MTKLQTAIRVLQNVLNMGGAKIAEDGTWGPMTQAALNKRIAADAKIPAGGASVPVPPNAPIPVPGTVGTNPAPTPAANQTAATPWMTWMKNLIGRVETDPAFSKYMSQFWKLCGLDYTTIAGAAHAWCALTVEAAFNSCGIKGSGSAAAVSYQTWGFPCGWIYGAVIPIRHASGQHHVTFFVKWADEANKIATCLGGNQGDALKESNFDLRGNAAGVDECVSGPRWPTQL